MKKNIFKHLTLLFTVTFSVCFVNPAKAQDNLHSLPLNIDTGYSFTGNRPLIRDVSHPKANIVYLSTDNALYKSTNNGDSWEKIYCYDSNYTFSLLYFYDENIGLAHKASFQRDNKSLRSDSLMKTYDGGNSWTAVSTSTVHDLFFVNKDTIVGLGSYLHCSYDGGYTWKTLLKEKIHSFSVLDDLTIYAVHGESSFNNTDEIMPKIRVWKSSDFGKWWTLVFPKGIVPPIKDNHEPKPPYEISFSHFWDNGKGIIEGHNKILTRNDFETYERKGALSFDCDPLEYSYLNNGYRVSVYVSDGFHFMRGSVSLSKSYGWNSKNLELDGGISIQNQDAKVCACEEDTVFFVVVRTYDDGSRLFRIESSDFEGLAPLSVKNLDSYNGVSVSPNPTEGLFKVSSESPVTRVLVYDLLGKEVYRKDCPRELEAEIDISSQPSGTYIVKALTKEGFGEAKVVKK